MRLRVVLLVAVATCLLALTPYTVQVVPWQYDPTRYPDIVRWAGCKAGVISVSDASPIQSYYSPANKAMVIGIHEDPNIPYYAGLFIVFHETGHCLQDQAGVFDRPFDLKTIELDADRQATDLACGLGLDGRKILHDTFIWARDTFDYHGDRDHGTLDERMSQGAKARYCDKNTPRFAHAS